MNPEQIKVLQRQLQAEGLYTGKIDGILGKDTQEAAKALQARQAAAAEQQQRQQQIETERLKEERLAREQRQHEIDVARQRQQQDFERSPIGQTYEVGKALAPLGAGMYLGHRMASSIEQRQAAMDPLMRATMGTGRRFAPYAAKSMTYFIPEGLALRNYVAPSIENETGREFTKGAGTFLLGAGAGTLGEGLVKSLTPPAVPNAPMGAPNLPTGPDAPGLPPPAVASAMGTPPAAPAPTTPPAPSGPPPLRRPSDRLVSAAKAAGGSGSLTKAEAADHLLAKGSITNANRMAVASELGVKAGPNFAKRLADRITFLKSSRTPLAIIGAAGALAYDAGSNEAEAAGATPGEARIEGAKEAATAAGGAAAGTYGLTKILEKMPMLGRALNMGGAMMAPMMAADAYDPTPEQLAMDRNVLARKLPSWLQFGAIKEAADMSQVPPRNPLRAPMGAGLPLGGGQY